MDKDLQKQILSSLNESPGSIFSVKDISEKVDLADVKVKEFDIIKALEAMVSDGLVNTSRPDKSTGRGYFITEKGEAFVNDR